MRFKITTSGSFYNDEDAEKLTQLGFKFEPTAEMLTRHNLPTITRHRQWYKIWGDENDEVYREFATLEELMAFVAEWGEVVLKPDEVEIYDNYRE